MRDLLVITPTRGRPGSARRLIAAMAATCTARTDLVLAIDDDDGSYADLGTGPGTFIMRGARRTCPAWTNLIARAEWPLYRAVASLGDDHVPETPGWDSLLLAAIEDMGGTGISYPDDTLQGSNLPTAPVVSSDIVAALGWLFLPGLIHLFADNVLKDIGEGAGCLRYVPGAVVRHLHYTSGLSPRDATYIDAEPSWGPDEAAYKAWRAGEMAADVARVRALRGVA